MKNGLTGWLGTGALAIAGLAIGWFATPAVMARLTFADPIIAGPWRTSKTVGGVNAGHYTRAYVARTALLALNRAETIYFEAAVDDAGRPLRAGCSYDLSGGTIQARWWSITAYADDYYLIPNSAKRYSFTLKTLSPDAAGRFTIALGPTERAGSWLPTGDKGGGFNLLLRLYNPDGEIATEPGLAKLPAIVRVGECRA